MRNIKRIKNDDLAAVIQQAIAVEQQRIENLTDAGIDAVGGGIDIPTGTGTPAGAAAGILDPKNVTMGMFPGPDTVDILGSIDLN